MQLRYVALSTLRGTTGRDGALLGLPSIVDHLFDVSPFPNRSRRRCRLVCARSKAPALTGLEQRGCWQEREHAEHEELAGGPPSETHGGRPYLVPERDGLELMPDARAARDFVPVELLRPIVVTSRLHGTTEEAAEAETEQSARPMETEIEPAGVDRTSLFGDLEAY